LGPTISTLDVDADAGLLLAALDAGATGDAVFSAAIMPA